MQNHTRAALDIGEKYHGFVPWMIALGYCHFIFAVSITDPSEAVGHISTLVRL